MRKSTRQELRKCRELIRYLLRGRVCYFCRKTLVDDKSYAKDGDAQGSPIATDITIHHIDLNHNNDAEKNKTPCHSTCHRRFHMTIRWMEKKGDKAGIKKLLLFYKKLNSN